MPSEKSDGTPKMTPSWFRRWLGSESRWWNAPPGPPACSCCWDYAGPSDDCAIHGREADPEVWSLRPRILDLFCGAGGAAVGYHRAGFDVVGVDIEPQPNYPFEFIQADALEYLTGIVGSNSGRGATYAAVHASPPCQAHSDLQKQSKRAYRDFIPEVRRSLQLWDYMWGIPYVIENVEGAPLIDPVRVCGASIPGLRVIRHRLFESNLPLAGVPCPAKHPLVFTHDKRKAHHGKLDQDTAFVQVTGGGNCTVANKRAAMGVPWMTGHEANEAIPPAYTEHIGAQLMAALKLTPVAEAVAA